MFDKLRRVFWIFFHDVEQRVETVEQEMRVYLVLERIVL